MSSYALVTIHRDQGDIKRAGGLCRKISRLAAGSGIFSSVGSGTTRPTKPSVGPRFNDEESCSSKIEIQVRVGLQVMMHQANRYILVIIAAQVLMLLPPAAAEQTPDLMVHLSIPIRWCAVQGSPIVEARSRVSSGTIDENLRARHTRATTFVWMPQSGISFRSALTPKTRSRIGFPIIQDPDPPKPDGSGGPGLEGDILAPSLDHRKRKELNMAVGSCERAWEQLEDQLETNFEGILGINIRRFVQPDGRAGRPPRSWNQLTYRPIWNR